MANNTTRYSTNKLKKPINSIQQYYLRPRNPKASQLLTAVCAMLKTEAAKVGLHKEVNLLTHSILTRNHLNQLE